MEIISKQRFEFQRETLDNARIMGHDRGSKRAADLAKRTYEEITKSMNEYGTYVETDPIHYDNASDSFIASGELTMDPPDEA
ncbi:MAG: hypothetical protein M1587_12265 [Thaumarchaeota archaeon]|nr:hypothetical protein [Nitrososphaerota archaeon]